MREFNEWLPCSSCGGSTSTESGMFVWNRKDLLYDRVCQECTSVFCVWADTAGHLEEEGILTIDWQGTNIDRFKR